MESLGEKVSYYRKSKGLSIKDLSEDLCDISTIYRLEKGKQLPRLEILNDICLKLEIPFKALFPYNTEVENLKKMCREFTYLEDYLSLELVLEECELVIEELNSSYSKVEFRKYVDWHKAILLHKKDNNVTEAIEILESLITLDTCVSELDICIANSLGLINLSIKNNEAALKIYNKIYPKIKNRNVIDDYTLIPRVGYNYSNTYYKLKKHSIALEIAEEVRYYLEVHHLNYSLGEVFHLIGILSKDLGFLDDAAKAFEKAILVFTLTNEENYLERTKEDLLKLSMFAGI